MDLLAPILRRSVAVVSVVRGEYVAYIYGKDRRRHGRRAREPDLKALWKLILDGHGSEARSGCTPDPAQSGDAHACNAPVRGAAPGQKGEGGQCPPVPGTPPSVAAVVRRVRLGSYG